MEHIKRRGGSDTESLSLANRKMRYTAMSAKHAPRHIDDLSRVTRFRPQLPDEPRIGSLRNKADILAIGLISNHQAETPRQRTGLLLGEPAQRETQKFELGAGRGEQKIALIARLILRLTQFGPIPPRYATHIMPGGECGRPEIAAGAQQIAKLDPLIAADAGYRRFAAAIRFGEVLDDLRVKPALVIQHVMSDSKAVGNAPRIADILAGTTRALPPDHGAVIVELQGDANDLKALLNQEGSGH